MTVPTPRPQPPRVDNSITREDTFGIRPDLFEALQENLVSKHEFEGIERDFMQYKDLWGYISSTPSKTVEWRWGAAGGEATRRIYYDSLLAPTMNARVNSAGEVQLLQPGPWNFFVSTWAEGTGYAGSGMVSLDVKLFDKAGEEIHQLPSDKRFPGTESSPLKTQGSYVVSPSQLPVTVKVWFQTGKWRAFRGGSKFAVLTAWKLSSETLDNKPPEDTGGIDEGDWKGN